MDSADFKPFSGACCLSSKACIDLLDITTPKMRLMSLMPAGHGDIEDDEDPYAVSLYEPLYPGTYCLSLDSGIHYIEHKFDVFYI